MTNNIMMEESKQQQAKTPAGAAKSSSERPGARSDARTFRIRQRGPGGRGRFGARGSREQKTNIPEQSDYEDKTLEIARVTRVTAGGKRMRFRALGIVGNRKGRAGFGLGKGTDVAAATSKAFAQARKNLVTIPIVRETIPHEVTAKYCSAIVLLKPAPKGTGVKAGGAVRQVLEIAGIPNVVSKIMGSPNKVNNVKATFKAFRSLRRVPSKEKAAGGEDSKVNEQANAKAHGANQGAKKKATS